MSQVAKSGHNTLALTYADFVGKAVEELLFSSFRAPLLRFPVPSPPNVVNPLSVSIQNTGKKRLILDLRHVNKHIWRKKFKFEDTRNASIYLPTVIFMFKFDINSGYHHTDILDDHQTFLAFSLVVNGVRKFFAFTVLPFGLC